VLQNCVALIFKGDHLLFSFSLCLTTAGKAFEVFIRPDSLSCYLAVIRQDKERGK